MITSNGRPSTRVRVFDALADRVVVTVAEARQHPLDVDDGLGAQASHDSGDERAVAGRPIDDSDAVGGRGVVVGFVLVIDDTGRIVPPRLAQDESITAQQIVLGPDGRSVTGRAEAGVEHEHGGARSIAEHDLVPDAIGPLAGIAEVALEDDPLGLARYAPGLPV